MGLTLEQIRQQFNIPKNVSDNEVIRIAQENNIVIDFSGNDTGTSSVTIGENETIFGAQQGNQGTGTYGDAVSFSHTEQTAQNQETFEQKLTRFYGRLYTDADSAKKQELVTQYIKNVINSGNRGALEDLKRLVANTPADSEVAQALLEAVRASNNEELISALPENFAADVQAASAQSQSAQSQSTQSQITVDDLMQNPNLSEIRLVNGKLVAFDKDGHELTDAAGKPLNISGTLRDGLASIEFKDGKVIQKDKDGKVIREDDAAAGQVGYQKDGESIEERLARFFYASYKTDKEGAIERIRNLSPAERRELEERYFKWCKEANGERVAKADFYRLVKNTGMDAQHMRDYAITVLHMSEQEADEVIRDFSQRLYTKEAQEAFLTGVVENADMAESPEVQVAATRAAASAAQEAGLSAEEGEAIGNAIAANKFHGKEATLEVLRTQYGLSAEQANKFYASLPEDVRQQMEDETVAAVSTVQAEVAADSSQPEEVRHDAADLSTEYITYIDDAEYQMQTIRDNSDYMMQNADEEMQQYYNNSIANNAYNYDISNREDIIRMVQELGDEKTLEILENARKSYEEQTANAKALNEARKAELQRKQQAQTKKSDNTAQQQSHNTKVQTASSTQASRSTASIRSIASAEGISRAVLSDSFKDYKVKDKEDFINSLKASDRKDAISSIIENAQAYELDQYMFSSLKNDILKYLVSHPSPANNSKLQYLDRYLSPDDKKMIKEMEEELPTVQAQRVEPEPQSSDADAAQRRSTLRFGFIGRH